MGRALSVRLEEKYGKESITVVDIARAKDLPYKFARLNIHDSIRLEQFIRENKVNHIINLVNMLPSEGELDFHKVRDTNIRGIENILDVAAKHKCAVFNASSIAVYEALPSKQPKPEDCVMLPSTIYGVSKIYGELLGEYYWSKYLIDFRSLRYPILLSSELYTEREIGFYMNQMFFQTKYTCYTNPNTQLPAMHVDDCARAIQMLIEADDSKFTRRVYNLAGVKFTAKELAHEISKHVPNFECTFKPDYRQIRINGWPIEIDDSSNKDWGWEFKQTLPELVDKIFNDIKANSTK